MMISNNYSFLRARSLTRAAFLVTSAAVLGPASLAAQSSGSNLLTTRAELTAAMEQAETKALTGNANNQMMAASIRRRLTNGDFQVGDRVLLSYVSDTKHTDTLAVRDGLVLELPARATVSLSGVLRSELRDKVVPELLRYVKASQVEVAPLTRVAVLGEVVHPGYFALRSDEPLSEAIMAAGGAGPTADVSKSIMRRANGEVRSSSETHKAITLGLTLDQFGVTAGDELVVGKKRDMNALVPVLGAIGSLSALFVVFHHK